MSTSRTAHKAFATSVLGVSEKIYDEMQAANESKNALVRAARATLEAALFDPDLSPAGCEAALDAFDKQISLHA